MSFALLLMVTALWGFGVGMLGFNRLGKDRRPLKSYEDKAISLTSLEEVEMERARKEKEISFIVAKWIQSIVSGAFQLTGLPLLLGNPEAEEVKEMEDEYADLPVLETIDSEELEAEEDDDEYFDNESFDDDSLLDEDSDNFETSSEDERVDEETQDLQTLSQLIHATDALPRPQMLDGLVFYRTVRTVAVKNTDIIMKNALMQTMTSIKQQRIAAQQEASIQKIQQLYPDIVCLHKPTKIVHPLLSMETTDAQEIRPMIVSPSAARTKAA